MVLGQISSKMKKREFSVFYNFFWYICMYLCYVESLSWFRSKLDFLRIFKVAQKSGQSPCTIVHGLGPIFIKNGKERILHFYYIFWKFGPTIVQGILSKMVPCLYVLTFFLPPAPTNAVSILISSDFLRMETLVSQFICITMLYWLLAYTLPIDFIPSPPSAICRFCTINIIICTCTSLSLSLPPLPLFLSLSPPSPSLSFSYNPFFFPLGWEVFGLLS